jgi:signal transduction histidine kinase
VAFLVIGLMLLLIALFTLFSLLEFSTPLLIMVNILVPLLAVVLLVPVLRKRVPAIEMRANQAVAGLLYSTLVVAVTLSAAALLNQYPPEFSMAAGSGLVILGFLLAPYFYPRFRDAIYIRLLRIPLRRDELALTTADNIVTSLELERLAELWKGKLLPTLMVRQGALLGLDEKGVASPLVLYGVEEAHLPGHQELEALLDGAGHYRPIPDENQPLVCPWVRLVLPLRVENRTIGACLLGLRDPDDFYSMEELPALRAIMNQIALALYNIKQTAQLEAFHHHNIQNHEQQQAALARDLHDDVLNQMALISMNFRDVELPPSFQEAYQKVIDNVRSMVNGLRPPMLEYGLHDSLSSLVDDLSEQVPQSAIDLQFKDYEDEMTHPRYPREVEIQLYRIAQEACRNALRHAPNSPIVLTIRLAPAQVEMNIRDHGPGFDTGGTFAFTYLLTNRHFGLANIYERAQIIGALVTIDSALGQGTKVHVLWKDTEICES